MARITRDVVKRATDAQADQHTAALVQHALLSRAFDTVKDKADWKAPIDSTLIESTCEFDPDVIADAIQFFTATHAKIEAAQVGIHRVFRITALGYREGPAGP